MTPKFSHQHRLLQRMALTPQMRQSIQLLNMSVKDLSEYINSVLAQNPFLQKLVDRKAADKYRKGQAADTNFPPDYRAVGKQSADPRATILSQLRMTGLPDKTLEIAEYLIYEMDENGYIAVDPEEAASDLSVSIEDTEEALEAIQKMDPPGIGARDVRECLQLQLKRRHKEDSLEYKIVTDLLNEVARNDVERIAKALKADEAKVREAINYIRKLNPRPASTLLSKESEKVTPELIARVESDKIRIELNRETLPQVKLYNPYEHNLDIIKDPEAREFLKENMDAAKNLMDNLKRREDTVCKVANYILAFQKDALIKNKHELKTLTIKGVAEALDFHPSTISRAVSNKYIQVNDKVIPMASLLSHGIKKENGEVASKTSVKKRIADLVKAEDRSSPLTDDEIREKLKDEGIMLQRRTIAKYRESLKILPGYLRRKKLGAGG